MNNTITNDYDAYILRIAVSEPKVYITQVDTGVQHWNYAVRTATNPLYFVTLGYFDTDTEAFAFIEDNLMTFVEKPRAEGEKQ